MALLPYYYSCEEPSRLLDRQFDRISRDLFGPGSLLNSLMRPMEQLSKEINQLTVNDADSMEDYEKFQVNVDVQHFSPEQISVTVVNGHVIVEGKHEEKLDEHGYISRRFVRRYALPKGCLPDTVQSKLSSDGVLTISAPKVLPMPSIGERIVPIIKTGPVRKQLTSSEQTTA